jgi:excinuclease ABC subunit C
MSALKELQRVLGLEKLPGRIEAYDISNIQGTNPVGSMVVFDFGRPKKSDYRKFKINKKQTPDDYAMMKEVLERRLKHSVSNSPALPNAVLPPLKIRGGTKAQPRAGALWPLPDLILIDGGKGQLNAAIAAISNFEFLISKKIPIISIAKRIEEIFLPKRKNPLTLPGNSIALFLLQRIRDEAHRFAIRYHRYLRAKKSLTSILDSITGIGPAKKKMLLEKFGSASLVRKASLTELRAIVGAKAAEKIKASI